MQMKNFKEDFPLLRENPVVYLDSAATAQRPESVINSEMEFYKKCNANPLRGLYDLGFKATECYEQSRETVRKFINARSEREIIFTRNATESLNLVAYSYGMNFLKKGDEILVTVMEHHSNQLPWRVVAEKTGAAVKYIECNPDGTITEEQLKQAFSERTRLVAVTHISNVLGCKTPIKRITELAKECGAVVVLDASQSVPHIPVDVQSLDVDFLAFSGHKLMGPMGIGVLYGKEALLEEMPPFMTGGEMIQSVTTEGAVWAELPHKFEAGTVNAAGAAGLAAAISYINKIGFETIEQRELELTRHAMEGLAKIPHVHVIGSEDPANHTGIVAFTIDNVHPHDVSEIMAADGIDVRAGHHCAQPLLTYLKVYNTTRASFMFYNTIEEVDAFVESVANVRRRMGYGE